MVNIGVCKVNSLQCKYIPDVPILQFLAKQTRWSTHGNGYPMPTVQHAMPESTPRKLQIAKMVMLKRRGLVDGCGCGCRGDWRITDKGVEYLNKAKAAMMTVCRNIMADTMENGNVAEPG